jgi:hypothetical protein
LAIRIELPRYSEDAEPLRADPVTLAREALPARAH